MTFMHSAEYVASRDEATWLGLGSKVRVRKEARG